VFKFHLISAVESILMEDDTNVVRDITITDLADEEIDLLRSLVDEFVLSHSSLRFRVDHWFLARDWLLRIKDEENSRVLTAKSVGRIVGFAVGRIVNNGPLLFPEKIGSANIIVVATEFRKSGIGNALWNAMEDWFLLKGIGQVEVYTECGNTVAENFWKNQGFSIFMNRRRCRIDERS
jgi:ribosomal protein S18 acetylase RimI-like enzyme